MIRLINILFLLLFFFSCKKITEKEKNKPLDQKVQVSKKDVIHQNFDKIESIQHNDKLDINGTWICYKYVADNRFEKKYNNDFAQEISKYSKFEIKNNVLTLGNCTKEIYTYNYSTKLKKYDDESTFITSLKPKKDSVSFIGAINSGENINCDIVDNFTYYINDNNLVQFDRGYFFYYTKKNKSDSPVINLNIKGIPGNNRNEWSVTGTFIHLKSLEDAYHYFRKEFPYGAQNTTSNFPKNNEFFDDKNRILYHRSNDELKIIKDDPMGKIIIKITKNDNKINLNYEMQYSEY